MATAEKLSEIFTQFLEHMPLTDVDRQHLREERGLSDALIDEWGFRSGGKHVARAMELLKEQFSEELLIDAGLLQDKNGISLIDASLFAERIIIPYRVADGRGVSVIRPHKRGLRGIAPQVFCDYLLHERPEQVVITEGEFKTLALHAMGIPSIAVPGVSSLSGRYLDKLLGSLQQFGVAHAIISFDNDEKDNPQLREKFKAPNKRYDTEFYAYVMAQKLAENGIRTSIAPLPDAWRIDGKADIDSAWVKLGKTRSDFIKLFSGSLSSADYLKQLPDTAQRVVKRKITAWRSNLPLRRELGKYIIERYGKDDEVRKEAITNFVMDIKHIYESGGEVTRLVEFVNEYGERSEPFILRPEEMGADGFRKFCFSKGNYLYKGNGMRELNMILEHEFMESPAVTVQLPRTIGEVRPGTWLFGNCAIHGGHIYDLDEDGIAWLDETRGDERVQVGYKPQALATDIQGDSVEGAFPILETRPATITLSEVGKKLAEGYGGYDAYLGLGWVLATLFSRNIFTKYKSFPIFFLRGKRRSGKTTFMRFLLQFFGSEQDGMNLPEATAASIMRPLGYYSSLGMWLEEYRNQPQVTRKDGLLRTTYDRQSVGRGVKQAFGTVQYPVRAGLAISGQESPEDNALFSRCVLFNIAETRLNAAALPWLRKHASTFSALTRDILLNYDAHCPAVLSKIAELRERFEKEEGIDNRTAVNWSIFLGALLTFLPELEAEIMPWAMTHCINVAASGDAMDELSQFLQSISVAYVDRLIDEGYVRYDSSKNEIYIWMTGCFTKFAEMHRRQSGRPPFDKSTIISYLREEPYTNPQPTTKRMGGETKQVYVLEVDKIGARKFAARELLDILRPSQSTGQGPAF